MGIMHDTLQRGDDAVELLERLWPYLDRLICYGSTRTEYEPNDIVFQVGEFLKKWGYNVNSVGS